MVGAPGAGAFATAGTPGELLAALLVGGAVVLAWYTLSRCGAAPAFRHRVS